MKNIQNLKTEDFDSIYSTNASFGNIISNNATFSSLKDIAYSTLGNIFCENNLFSTYAFSDQLECSRIRSYQTGTIPSLTVINDLFITGGNIYSGYINTKSFFYTQSSQSNANGITLTASMVLSGLINRTTAGAGKTDTLDTATNFVSALSNINTGYVLRFIYFNNSSNNITLAGGTGCASINGSTTMTAGKCHEITIIFIDTSNYHVIIST